MKPRSFPILLAAAFSAACVCAHARTLKEIRSDGTLRVCVAGSNAEFYKENAVSFARFLGVFPEVKVLPDWDRQFQNADGVTVREATYESNLLADGSCDVFPNDLHVLDWRSSKMLLVPYYTVRSVVIGRRDLRGVLKRPADLAGRTAAVQKGTGYDAWLQAQNKGDFADKPVLIIYAPTEESMRLVAAGDADFTIAGSESAFRWVRVDLNYLDILFPIGEAVQVGWGIQASAKDLREQLQRFFDESKRVGSDLDRAWLRQHGISLMEYELFAASFGGGGIDLRTILTWALPIGSGILIVLVGMLFWNRRLKKAQAAVSAANERLEVARRTAEEATRAKSMFLASMSHEIRTPMNGVLGMLELLTLTRLDAEQRGTLNVVRDSARSLLRIIDDILDFSKIEAGKLGLSPEATSLSGVIEAVHGIYSGIASNKNLVLRKDVDPRISPALMVDPLRLRQILNNFLSNAIKFTQEGHVEIRAELVERSGDVERVRLSVADTGIGVSREAQARLFQPFVQAEGDTTKRFGGTGLGLTICSRLADIMQGRIEMESEPGKGTTMRFTVSLAIAEPGDLRSADTGQSGAAIVSGRRTVPSTAAAEIEGTLVLLVDDHPTNRALLTRQLNLLGYACESAEGGRKALELWKSGRFGIVITDCNMPEMDGYELARAIREEESRDRGGRTPIVACTANTLAGESETCIAAGMDDVMAKPVELAVLAGVMDRWRPLPDGGKSGSVPPGDRGSDSGSPVERSGLAQLSGGDADVEREILADFRTANDADMAELLDALSKGDLERVTRASHRLKGACRMIGAMALGEVCERMEKAGRKNDWEAVAIERGALDGEVGRLNAWLRRL